MWSTIINVLAVVSLCIAFPAAIFAWRVAITARSALTELLRKLDSSSTRSLTQLDSEVAKLELSLSSLSQTVKRVASKLTMQEGRARRSEELEEAPSDPASRKQWLRKKLAAGELRVIRDGSSPTTEASDAD
jgi:hypothetical protein